MAIHDFNDKSVLVTECIFSVLEFVYNISV